MFLLKIRFIVYINKEHLSRTYVFTVLPTKNKKHVHSLKLLNAKITMWEEVGNINNRRRLQWLKWNDVVVWSASEH